MKRIILFFVMIFGVQFAQNLKAQNKDAEISELVNQILMSRKTSSELLTKYSWTSRTEILKSKEILNIMIEKNQYDQQGQLVHKVINEQGAKMPKAFLIREIAESEKENIEKFLYGLRDFLKKYFLQETAQITRFISAATWQVVDSTHEFVFTGRNVEEEGDQMTWMVEDINYCTSRIEVHTTFLGDVVHFTGTFTRLRDGLNYMAYAEAYIPSKNITLQLQNYDYILE
ncbi:MAG: hypothetical protein M0Q38_00095 [Bacteroidales bacterium]|nr:hypothetical protein [Bacteroidales bacterium]